MTYTKQEVFSILQEILGMEVEGIYTPSEEFDLGVTDAFPIAITKYGVWDIESTSEVSVVNGATKIVLVPVNTDYVIKLNIMGTYLTEEQCESANYSYPHIDRTSTVDILDEENTLFEELPEELQELILPNIYVGKYCNMSVYIQKKIELTYGESCGSAEIRYRSKGENRRTNVQKAMQSSTPVGLNWAFHTPLPEAYISDIMEIYGEETTTTILQQLQVSGIDDLNYENFGYDIHGKPYIFDTAGFNESEFFDTDERFTDKEF